MRREKEKGEKTTDHEGGGTVFRKEDLPPFPFLSGKRGAFRASREKRKDMLYPEKGGECIGRGKQRSCRN